MCRDMHCHDVHHLESIDVFYSDICNALAHSSAQCIDVCRTGSAKDFIVPGFNEHVKTLHTEARNAYIIWKNIGRPRVGETCFRMRTTRLAFKYALRQCKCLDDTMRANALATSLLSKDTNSFWKQTRKFAPQLNLTTVLVIRRLLICGETIILLYLIVFIVL